MLNSGIDLQFSVMKACKNKEAAYEVLEYLYSCLLYTSGVPQGGPLSVVLSNVYLDKLDKELEQRGLRFTRYADAVSYTHLDVYKRQVRVMHSYE